MTDTDGGCGGGATATMTALSVHLGLFLTAFVAATILPAQSEAVLVAALLAGTYDPVGLVAAASLGNVGGSVVNWILGRGVRRFGERRWFPVGAADLDRAGRWYARWGKWSLLLSWAPIIGDPLTVVAGFLREPLPVFLVLVGLAKVGRYVVLAVVTLNWPA